jgi:ribonuclease Z
MKVIFLGSCGNQTGEFESVGFVVDDADERILVETGPGVVRQLYRAGIPPNTITAIVVTHAHADHSGGFAYAVWSSFYERLLGGTGRDVLKVFGLADVLTGLESTLRFAYNPAIFPFAIDYIPVDAVRRHETAIGSLHLITVPVAHTVPNIGIRVTGQRRSVAYSSDTVYAQSVVDLAQGTDLLIHEAFVDQGRRELAERTKHATAREAGRVAAAAAVKQLALVHFFPPLASQLDVLVAEAAAEYQGHVFVPAELSHLNL